MRSVAFDEIHFKRMKYFSSVAMLLIVVIDGLCGIFASTSDVESVTRFDCMSV